MNDHPVSELHPPERAGAEMQVILKPGTRVLVSEQLFHVSRHAFKAIGRELEHIGLEIYERPKIFLSRTVVMRPKGTEAREGTGG